MSLDEKFGRLDGKFSISMWVGGGLLTAILAIAGYVANNVNSMHRDIATVGAKVSIVEREMTAMSERIKAIETSTKAIVGGQNATRASLARIEGRLADAPSPSWQKEPVVAFAPWEQKLVMEILGSAAQTWAFPVKRVEKIGQLVMGGETKPIPESILNKIPALKNFQFTVDEARNIIFVALPENRVVGVVGSN